MSEMLVLLSGGWLLECEGWKPASIHMEKDSTHQEFYISKPWLFRNDTYLIQHTALKEIRKPRYLNERLG